MKNEFGAADSLDLLARRHVIVHEGVMSKMVGQLLTFIESITPDGEQQEARKQIIKKIIYSSSNQTLEMLRDSVDDLRKFYGLLEGEPEYEWISE